MGISIQEELWNIFTYYSLHGNPRDPSRINTTQFYNFCRDAMLFDPSMTESAMTQAQVQLTFTAQCRNLKSLGNGSSLAQTGRLTYDEFLTCLLGLAQKCYPMCDNAQVAMQQLLMDNILPLASRRKAARECLMAAELAKCNKKEVVGLQESFSPPLLQLFHYFAVETKSVEGSFESKGSHNKGSFDEMAKGPRSPSKSGGGPGAKKSENQISYGDFLKYCQELGVSTSLGLTTIDLGDIYLTTVATKNGTNKKQFVTTFSGLTFPEVLEALFRCAHTGYIKNTHVNLVDKMKAMFNCIWRHMQNTQTGKVTSESASNPIYRRRLRCFQLLNERFISMWTKDGFKDYLGTGHKAAGGISSIGMIMRGGSSSSSAAHDGGEAEDDDEDDEGGGEGESSDPDFEATPEGGGSGGDDGGAGAGVRVELEIEDEQDFGDPRMTPSSLIRLLRNRPELALLLKECMIEEGICEEV
jgi:hypothetical protein